MKRVALSGILIFLFLMAGTGIAIFYAKGYRFTRDSSKPIEGTGLLVLTSKPDAAKVFINNQIVTATNNTINLNPGRYDVEIQKEGYFPWKKHIIIKKEVVSRADALLLPTAPKLESITTTGASDPAVDYTGSLIAYTVASSSAQENGIYVLDMNAHPILPIIEGTTQIADDSVAAFSTATLQFSLDGSQLIASLPGQLGTTNYFLSTRSFNNNPQNITYILSLTQNTWKAQEEEKISKLIEDQKPQLADFIKAHFSNIVFSPNQEKILYQASGSATMPVIITPRLLGSDPTPENRDLQKDNIYVYDTKEDKNYLLFNASAAKDSAVPQFRWYPDSDHLVYIENKKIIITEYDGQNRTTVYAGPFYDDFEVPWIDGSGIVILTNLNIDNAPYNLYRLVLK